VSHAKVVAKAAVNAVVVARNAVMKHLPLTVAKPLLPMATQPTSVLNAKNALSKQSQQTSQRKVTSRLLAKKTAKNAHPANAAAVTVMAASAVNAVTVPSHRQTKLRTQTLRQYRQCRLQVQSPTQLQLTLRGRL
jgi:hypothetical protein